MTYDPYDLDAKAAEVNAILERPYTVNIGQYFNRGGEIFQQKLGEFVGFTFLYLIINFGLSNIPYVGSIISGLISGVLVAGYYFVVFRISRGQSTEFGDFFLSFRNNQFLPLLLLNLLMGLVLGGIYLIALLFIGLGFYEPIYNVVTQSSPSLNLPDLPELSIPPILGVIFCLVGFLLLIPLIYLSVCYAFALPLAVDRRLYAWQSMETSRKLIQKKWLSWWGFSILVGLLMLVGACACYIGILFTVPLGYCTLAAAYEDVVGLSQRNSLPE
jgi:hypothetical protein